MNNQICPKCGGYIGIVVWNGIVPPKMCTCHQCCCCSCPTCGRPWHHQQNPQFSQFPQWTCTTGTSVPPKQL